MILFKFKGLLNVLTILHLEVQDLGDFRGPYTSLLMIKRLLCVLGMGREGSHTAKWHFFFPFENIKPEGKLSL